MNQPPQHSQIAGETEHANPDLDRILAELAGFTGSNFASQQPTAVAPLQLFPSHHVPAQESLPAAPAIAERPRDPRLAERQLPQRIATPPTQPSTTLIDPSTIFDWPSALRCVNKLSASNPQFGPKIREVTFSLVLIGGGHVTNNAADDGRSRSECQAMVERSQYSHQHAENEERRSTKPE